MSLALPLINDELNRTFSLTELARLVDDKGARIPVAEVLNETNELLPDIPWVQGNLTLGHRTAIRTKLPDAYPVSFNEGVPPSKFDFTTVEEDCGMFQAEALINSDELEITGTDSEWRFQRDVTFIESLGQKMTWNMFYGTRQKTSEKGFNGFSVRYNKVRDKSQDRNQGPSFNVIDCGGTGKNLTSMWLIGWSPRTVYGIYPKGCPTGIRIENKPEFRTTDPNGDGYYLTPTLFKWYGGLVVEDWRYVVRLCNIDAESFKAGNGLGTGKIQEADTENLLMVMDDALNLIPTTKASGLKLSFYCNRDVVSVINRTKLRSDYGVEPIRNGIGAWGEAFKGIPIKRVDALHNKETQVK